MKNKIIVWLLPVILWAGNSFAQTELYKFTNLGNPKYYEDSVKYISDEEFFNSVNLKLISSAKLDKALKELDYENAYKAMGDYEGSKKYKRFIMDESNLLVTFEELKEKLNSDTALRNAFAKRAGLVMNNEINGWGTETVKFDSVVDFNTSKFGAMGKYGFNYWGWAQPLNYLYIITKNKMYLDKLERLFNDWYSQRYRITSIYPELEIVFYELGLGGRLYIHLPFYLQAPADLKWITHERMLKTFLGMGRFYYEIEKKCGYRSGNWQPVGSISLIQLGLYFPEFKESDEWIKLGVERIIEHLKYDFYPDGGHSERSPGMYSVMTYYTLRNAYYLLKNFEYEIPDKNVDIRKYFLSIVNWWISMISPDGGMPPLNDSHRIKFPEKYLLEKKNLFEDSTGLGILKTVYGKDVNYSMPDFTSINHDSSGFAIMRSGWEKNSYYMNITYGKFAGFHTHNDLLSFEVHANGKPHIIDAALGRTYDDTLYNKWYRTPTAHNTVSIVDDMQRTKYDSTMDRMNYSGENIKWSSLKNVDYFSGSHNAFHNYGVTLNRSILFLKPFYWLIIDSVENRLNKNDWIWNLHLIDNLRRRADYYLTSDTNGIIIYPLQKYRQEIDKGFAMLNNNMTQDDFRKISWLKMFGNKEMKSSLLEVLLYPYKNSPTNIAFSEIEGGGRLIVHDGFEDELYYSPGIKNKNLSTDAKIVIIRKKDNRIIYYAVIDGSYLEYKKNIILQKSAKNDYEGNF